LIDIFSSPERRFAAVLIVLTLLRVVSLVVGHPELGPDEGQYWFWSKAPAFGYFSKPPIVAWSIGATTALFGDAEWAVRLSAPLYQAGAAIFLFLIARRLANGAAAFWAGVGWLTLPGVFLSSALITTDSPLIFFWCAALYLFFVLTDAAAPKRPLAVAVLFGAAIGFGMLSKYAMIYFVLGVLLAAILSPARRRALRPARALIAILVALAVVAPNILWNAENDFQTISHTAANADWTGDFGHPDQLFKFLGDQAGVAGPVMLALILLAVFRGRSIKDAQMKEKMRVLVAFAVPAFAIVCAQAFISRAHGNWAAVSYPSAVVLATLWASTQPQAFIAARASIFLHSAVGAGFLLAFASWPFAERIGADAAFKQLRGWEAQGAAIAQASDRYDAIMTDDREITGELVYYARGGAPIAAWNSNIRIDSHFEAFIPYDAERHRRVLYVTAREDALYVQNRFRVIAPLGVVEADLGRGRTRRLYLFEVSGLIG
jgi:4-amino-4-deoxy-L-arabinose transferase-like glycosyltransferase